jgi:hypothetical protein
MSKPVQNLINHVALVIDASDSMYSLHRDVIRVVDDQIRYLAEESKRLDQETRITVYTFDTEVRCLFYDKDVLRLPSLKDHYKTQGWTALIDATLQSQEELAQTAQLHGDHAFLSFVITDGQENRSKRSKYDLTNWFEKMPDHWTVATLVPDRRGEQYAVNYGFPVNNIAIWDATSRKGLEDGFSAVRTATSAFMTGRASGIRGSRAVFSTGADAVNAEAIQQAALTPLKPVDYMLVPVTARTAIKAWVEDQCGIKYRLGKAFYQLTKREEIQGNKEIMILEKSTSQIYAGDQVRDMLGLGRDNVKVKPDHNDKYEIFVKSTSVNRVLLPGTKLLVLN